MLYDYGQATVSTIATETDAGLAEAEALIAEAVTSGENPSFDATLVPLDRAVGRVIDANGRGGFLSQVATDPALRDAGQAADERLMKWRVGLAFRADLYRAVSAFAATSEAEGLDGEQRYLLEIWMRDFRRAGQEMGLEVRSELEGLRARLVELEVAFQRNVNEARDSIEVGPAELEGLSDAFRERLAPGSRPETRRVSLDTPELIPFLEQSPSRPARHEMFSRNWSRAMEVNGPLMREALRIRQRVAELHGMASWAQYGMAVKMAGHPDRVRAFYDEIVPATSRAAERETAAMQAMLEADDESGPIGAWDWRFYDFRQRRDEFGVDSALVTEYLPLDRVLEGLFSITGEVFGLRYRRVPDAHAWHPSVELYEIRDAASDELKAWVYMDLFPRDGKFNHAAAYPLVVGRRRADGGYERPVTAIVANLTPPSGDRPALLRHVEVETLFHEFGHVLHMSLTRAESARFSGAEVEWDFVEAPSQIMEHWAWEPEVLGRFARHYRSGDPIPHSLVEQIFAAQNLNAGIRAAVQVFYGTIDLALHDGQAEPDLDEITRAAHEVTQLAYPDGTFMLASFAHLMGGYDAGYYGYLWAEALGDDMWGRFEREGITSPELGAEYRRKILEPNGSRTADEMFADFVGRPPSTAAWLHYKGFSSPPDR
ncbi:MAG: Zn-dependent oligopeptidase [Chloroflexota bacterium]|nr:Zn-dependent oligopeptidase [Chloroflexota bacterium]